MKSEIRSHLENNTWTLIPRPRDVNVLSCKRVFNRKLQASSTGKPYTRFKARHVCREFEQKFGLDYEETYAPVVKLTTFRVFFAIYAHLGIVVSLDGRCDSLSQRKS